MKPTKTVIGKEGEELAARFLEEKGFEVVARNFRHGRSEIDLIVRKDNLMVFAEVKLRNRIDYGMPEEFVTEQKADRIIEAAENYIFKEDWKGKIRFDIIAIKGKNEILHLEDAFG